MIILKGKSICAGIAMGKLFFYSRAQQKITEYKISDTKQELRRFEQAREEAIQELKQLYDKALQKVGKSNAMIFEIHRMMLNDMVYCDSVMDIISSQNVSAEYAVCKTADTFSEMLSSMADNYMKARAADIVDVSERLIKVLCNAPADDMNIEEPVIIAADDLVPSETVQLDKNKVLGFVTMYGSPTSHSSILTRTMNIPAVAGIGEALKTEYNGCEAIVDGTAGVLYINPDDETRDSLCVKKYSEDEKKSLLQRLKGKENITLDGQKINICANISSLSDIDDVLQNDADGIGLFRSEFLYMENSTYPTEEQQFQVYKAAARHMGGKKVIIRTLDMGADKKADYFKLPSEKNPAMGYRAIRICLTQQDVFKTQLRAIYRAAVYGNISIMFPMIISLQEVLEIKQLISQVKQELTVQGIAYSETVELGIMIETPAAALISDLLAKEVDFFSIGTNDLTQYTLAIDRQNSRLERFYNAHHQAILRLIKMVADNAHQEGIWVGICGEMAAEVSLTETFLSMGIDELSVAASFVLPLRKHVRELNVGEIKNNMFS